MPPGLGNTTNSSAVHDTVELNIQRIARLGKKVSDLDHDMVSQLRQLREETFLQSQKLGQIIAFLPRRQRRTVERMLAITAKQGEEGQDTAEDKDDAAAKDKADKGGEGKKRVGFREEVAETKSFEVDDEQSSMPWQLVGQPERRWRWCYQPLNEMGRELALYFDQLEQERTEFERDVTAQLDALRDAGAFPRTRGSGGRSSQRKLTAGEDGGGGMNDSESMAPDSPGRDMVRLTQNIEATLAPRLAMLEERAERTMQDFKDLKKDVHRKLDKDEFQLLSMRFDRFLNIDLELTEGRLEVLEGAEKVQSQQLEKCVEDVRRVEANSAQRSELVKVRSEIGNQRIELQKLSTVVKDSVSGMGAASKRLHDGFADLQSLVERTTDKLLYEKVGVQQFAELVERLRKVESSLSDNRQILSEAGGQEVSHVIRRIILNLEDKLMVIEKKVDALTEGRLKDATDWSTHLGKADGKRAPEELSALNDAIESVGNTVTQLKHELGLRKVDWDHLAEQGQLHLDLAQRLEVAVGPGVGAGSNDEATTLTLSRVQVMVAAAARQLVAGSKWVTKETFDMRIGEFRKEYLQGSRTLQSQIEDLATRVSRAPGQDSPRTLVAGGEDPGRLGKRRAPLRALQGPTAQLRSMAPPVQDDKFRGGSVEAPERGDLAVEIPPILAMASKGPGSRLVPLSARLPNMGSGGGASPPRGNSLSWRSRQFGTDVAATHY